MVVTGRNHARLEETLATLTPGDHRAEPFDLDAAEEIPRWIAGIAENGGPLHGIVHAAGKQTTMPLRFLTAAATDDILRTNLTSAVMLARGFSQKKCRAAEGGSLVFVSSVMGLVSRPALAAYSASKAALGGLVRALALELAKDRIRVNCVAPAFVETPMLDGVRESLTPEQFAALEAAHPLGFGAPRDVAHSIAFLLAGTGRWITGSTLVVDGGYSVQ